jgi:hypothetical protein
MFSLAGTGFNDRTMGKQLKCYVCHIKLRQVQVIEGDYERDTHFCNWLLQTVHDGVLDPEFAFVTKETWVPDEWDVSAQNEGTRVISIRDRLLKYLFTIRRLMCVHAVTAT